MNRFLIYLFIIILFSACQEKVKTEEKKDGIIEAAHKVEVDIIKQVIDTIFLTKTDTAFVVKSKPIPDDMGDKQKEYSIRIFFSPQHWPVLTYKSAIGADLFLTGDLDGDGLPELLLRPEWFSSCWASINLFSLKNNSWKLLKKGSMYFCSDEYPLGKRIIKTDKGYGLLTDSLADDKFITLKNEIKF